MYLALKHNLIFHRCRHPLVPTDTQTAPTLISHASAQTQVQPFRMHHARRLSHIISVPVTLKCDDEDDPNGNDNRTGLPHYFPSLTSRYVQVSGQHASQHRGTHFPTLLSAFPSSKENEDGAETSPNTLIFLLWCFCSYRAATNICSYPDSAMKICNQRIPNLIRKEYRGLGKYNFSWDSHTAMTWITAVCWWHPVLLKSH